MGVALAGALAAACSSGGQAIDPLPPPPTTAALPSTTAPVDYSSVPLPAARGRTTTTTLVVGPGQATLSGKVLAPDGSPVESATVRAERLVGGAVAGAEVASAVDGAWTLAGVLGGRYRLRAWRAPDLAMVKPALVFVGAAATVPAELKLERFAGPHPTAAIAPNPPVVGRPATLVVQVVTRSVDGAGIVQAVPMPGVGVELTAGPTWTVATPNPTVTDGAGRARWELACAAAGAQPLRLVVGGTDPFQLALPACAEPPPPTTAPAPGATTSSTAARPPTTTTTTTKPRPRP